MCTRHIEVNISVYTCSQGSNNKLRRLILLGNTKVMDFKK